MPIGGTVSGTALNVSAGARSRWANLFSGLVVVVEVLAFSQLVSQVAIPAMAGLLIVAGVQSIKVDRIADIPELRGAPWLFSGYGRRKALVVHSSPCLNATPNRCKAPAAS